MERQADGLRNWRLRHPDDRSPGRVRVLTLEAHPHADPLRKLRIQPPPSRPFDLEAQLTQTHDVYEFADLKGRIGETDVAGDATYDRSGERPRVQAALRSQTAHVADLRSLLGMSPASKRDARESDVQRERVFPARPLRVDRLNAFDASVRLDAKRLKAPDLPMIDSLSVVAELANGVLELKPMDLGIAGGRIAGAIRLDARREPPASAASVELRDVKLERLLGGLGARSRSSGPISGHMKLAGQGRSIAAMLANANGSLSARLVGGSISNAADAKLALNLGKLLGLALRGDRDIAIGCAALAFDVGGGIARARRIVLDTEQTRIAGAGTIDLRKERWDLLLTPEPKTPALLRKRGSIHVNGALRRPDFSIQERVAIGRDRSTPDRNRSDSPADRATANAPSTNACSAK